MKNVLDYLGIFFSILISSNLISSKAYSQSISGDPSNPHVETALVAFYGVFFIEDHFPLDFFNSEDPEQRINFSRLLEASHGTRLEEVILESLESLRIEIMNEYDFLVSFTVPGGEIFYTCHSHESVTTRDNHCSACRKDGSIDEIILSSEISFSIRRRCT